MFQDPAAVVTLFAATLLAATVGVQLSGYFPAAERPDWMRGPVAAVLITGATVSALALLAASMALAAARVSVPVAVIAVGLAALGGPLAFQALPAHLRDSRPGLAAAAILCAAAAAGLGHLSGALAF